MLIAEKSEQLILERLHLFNGHGIEEAVHAAVQDCDFFTDGQNLSRITNDGPLSNDRRHQLKVSGLYVFPFKLSVGALCKAKKEGKTKHIGVANFTTSMLDEAWAVTSEPLVCNQIEMHPFIDQDKVLAACKKHGMAVVAYCPIARGKVPGADALERIGKAHGKSAAQVSLRYLVQRGVCPIPRTAAPEHLKQNLNVFDFKLSDSEMAELMKLNDTNMRVVNPPHAPKWDTP